MTQAPPDAETDAWLDLATQRRTVAVVAATFVLLLGVPAALFAYQGRWDVAGGLLVVFALMVVVTAYAFRKAIEAQRAMSERED